MKYPEITIVIYTVLTAPLVLQPFATASNYVILSVTKNGLLELQLAHGKRRFLETSLANPESVHRIAFTGATDGLRLVQTVTRDGLVDDCITSTSFQDIASFTSKFSETSRNLVKLSEADVMNAYLKFNETAYSACILRRDRIIGQSNISSLMAKERTNSQSVSNCPDFRLWARINTTGNGLFINLFRSQLQVAQKSRECHMLHENATKGLRIINTDLKGVEHLTTLNKATQSSLRLRHYRHYLQIFSYEKAGLLRKHEVDPFNMSSSRNRLPTDMRIIPWWSSEDFRREYNIKNTFASEKLNTQRSVKYAQVQNKPVSKTVELYSPIITPVFSINHWKLVNVTKRNDTQDADRNVGKYAHVGTDTNHQTDRSHGIEGHSQTGEERNQRSDRHFTSQKQHESDMHHQLVRYKRTNRLKVTHVHRRAEHESEKHYEPDIHPKLDREDAEEVNVETEKRFGSKKHNQLHNHKYNVSGPLYASFRHQKTYKLDVSYNYGETIRPAWSRRFHESEQRKGNYINARGDTQHMSDRHQRMDRHHKSSRHNKSDRHHKLDHRSHIHLRLGKHHRHHKSHSHYKSNEYDIIRKHYNSSRHDESHACDETGLHKGLHRHHTTGRHAETDRHSETATLPLLQRTINVSDSVTSRNTEAGGSNEGSASLQTLVTHHGRPKRDLLTGWMIFPGTKWCGDGDIAEHKQDVGYHAELDKCCRRHDLCPLVIPRLTWRYGLFNYRLHTLSHCRCDRKLRKCLQVSASPLAHLIGQIYFNVIGPECFKFTQRTTCVRRLWWGGCQEWSASTVAYSKRQRRFK
ncbi:hypothetical protein BsWGS_07792 [Bradybaena similaris]